MKILILTGRTIDQGCRKEISKASREYVEAVAICEMNGEDMKRLGIKDGDNVKVTTRFGSVVLIAKRSKRMRSPGIAFIPYGLWANQVMGSETDGTGMPLLKGVPAEIEPTEGHVSTTEDLVKSVMHG